MAGIIEPIIQHELKDIVSKAAPILGTILGSPLAGIGISLLSSYFGLPNNSQKILDSLSNDPNVDAKLKQLEFEHLETLQQLKNQTLTIETNDIQNARQRQIMLHDWVPTLLAIGFLLCYATLQFYMVTHIATADDVISARLQDVLIIIISYYFGSSHHEPPK